jgi:hypothetical protein
MKVPFMYPPGDESGSRTALTGALSLDGVGVAFGGKSSTDLRDLTPETLVSERQG